MADAWIVTQGSLGATPVLAFSSEEVALETAARATALDGDHTFEVVKLTLHESPPALRIRKTMYATFYFAGVETVSSTGGWDTAEFDPFEDTDYDPQVRLTWSSFSDGRSGSLFAYGLVADRVEMFFEEYVALLSNPVSDLRQSSWEKVL